LFPVGYSCYDIPANSVTYLHKGASLSTTHMVPQTQNVTGMRVGMKINL